MQFTDVYPEEKADAIARRISGQACYRPRPIDAAAGRHVVNDAVK